MDQNLLAELEELHAIAATQTLPIPDESKTDLVWLRNQLISYDSFVDGIVTSRLMNLDVRTLRGLNEDQMALIEQKIEALFTQTHETSHREIIAAYRDYKRLRDKMLALAWV